MQLSGRLKQLGKCINHSVELLLLVLGFTMTVIVVSQVFARYILNHSLFWSEELARCLLVWLTFLGASVAYYRSAHPGVDIFYARMSSRGKRVSRILVHIASLILFGVMVFCGIQFAHFIRAQTTPALGLPKWIVFAVIPLSGIILTVHGIAFLLNDISCSNKDS